MNSSIWATVAMVGIGAAVAVGGSFTPAAGALVPLGASIIGGAMGWAMPGRANKAGGQLTRKD